MSKHQILHFKCVQYMNLLYDSCYSSIKLFNILENCQDGSLEHSSSIFKQHLVQMDVGRDRKLCSWKRERISSR